MKQIAVPTYDDSINTTGCCARFNPQGWDGRILHFKDKPFLRATTKSLAHVPLNIGRVFGRVNERIADAGDFVTKVFEGPLSAPRSGRRPCPDRAGR